MIKSVLIVKAHVAAYTRKDGMYVPAHEDRRTAKPRMDWQPPQSTKTPEEKKEKILRAAATPTGFPAGMYDKECKELAENGLIEMRDSKNPHTTNPWRWYLKEGSSGDSVTKSATITEPAAELVSEHRRLVAVLRSPSHRDDKEEADRQAAELEEYEEAEKSGKSMKKCVVVGRPSPS